MFTIENSTSIARPPEEVFAFVSDVRNDPQWHTDILEAQVAGSGPIGRGTIFAFSMKPFMGVSEGTETLSEYEPPRRAVLQGKFGKMSSTTILTIEPDREGSRFTRRIEMKPLGLMRAMAPFMKGMAHKQAAGFLENLKRVLEMS